MKKCLLLIFISFAFGNIFSQEKKSNTNELSVLFIGDIMGHDAQIESAFDSITNTYNFNNSFQYVNEIINQHDYAIANLEVTLAGPPYKGYPNFSSPDALAEAAKNNGINVLVTANNHSYDRGDNGVIRTINILDSLELYHTGTFKSIEEKKSKSPLILTKGNIKVALLNYTFGTNKTPANPSTVVNILNKESIRKDLLKIQSENVDKIIAFVHWGVENKRNPVSSQLNYAKYLFDSGVDIIIGAHPHVLEKMVWAKANNSTDKEKLVVYSLGNFVSNQRWRYSDGGAMFRLVLKKENNNTLIKEANYHLTWVYLPKVNGKSQYYVLPAAKYENNTSFFDTEKSYTQMEVFLKDSRKFFQKENKSITEFYYDKLKYILLSF